MGRRSDHTKEELKKLIIDATLKLVREKGVEQVTVRQIADAVGYTPGMLYSIFENLHAIFLHVNVVSLDSLYASCLKAQKKSKEPEESIAAMGLAYLKFAETNPHQFQLLFRTATAQVDAPAELNFRIRTLFELVEKELSVLAPKASQKDIELGSRTLWSGVHGAAALKNTDQLYSEEKKADQKVVKMLVRYFIASWQGKE